MTAQRKPKTDRFEPAKDAGPSLRNEDVSVVALPLSSVRHLLDVARYPAPGVDVSDPPILSTEGPDETGGIVDTAAAAALAQEIHEFRRLRDAAFGEALFSEPAWDILLYLFVADAAERCVPVSTACVASAVPKTTALRWIQHLEATGLVCRNTDPGDGRQSYVSLSPRGFRKMACLLGSGVRQRGGET